MNPALQEFLWPVGGCVIGMLAGGNLFFIKRLVDKIDSIEIRVIELAQTVRVLQVLQKQRGRGESCQELMV